MQILNLENNKITQNVILSANEYCKKLGIPNGVTAKQEVNKLMLKIMNQLKTEMENQCLPSRP